VRSPAASPLHENSSRERLRAAPSRGERLRTQFIMRSGRSTMATLCAGTTLCVLSAVPIGCTTGSTPAVGSRYVVTGSNAQFYKYGPAQSFGPDLVIPRGRKVTMLQRAFGYSRV